MLDKEDIKEINDYLAQKGMSWHQGIFNEPSGVPMGLEGPLIYQRWETGGYSGGDCWGGEAQRYSNDEPRPDWVALDKVLEKLFPTITYLQYKKLNSIIGNNTDTQGEYYGNSTNYQVYWLELSKLEEFIKQETK